MLSSFVIAFLPRRKCLLILWLQSTSAVILEPKKIKSPGVVLRWWRNRTGDHFLPQKLIEIYIIFIFFPLSGFPTVWVAISPWFPQIAFKAFGLVLTLSDAAHASLFSPYLLVAAASTGSCH